MKLAVFTYDFPHAKTAAGIMTLLAQGFYPQLVIGAPPVKLNFYQSQIRISPRDMMPDPPEKLARACGAEYRVLPHNSAECAELLKRRGIDIGIILGARILKQPTIEACKVGIINLHPGWLPEVRGLDTVKWAAIKELPMGATAHLIDHRIDMGRLLARCIVPVYKDDTLMDVSMRTQDRERVLLSLALKKLHRNPNPLAYEPLPEGDYHKAVPPEDEMWLGTAWSDYKRKHAQ